MQAHYGERTSLLTEQQLVQVDGDDGSEGTLIHPDMRGNEDGQAVDLDKANQQVASGRAVLIMFSLWGLIFLQGESGRFNCSIFSSSSLILSV